MLELVLDAAAAAAEKTGVGIGDHRGRQPHQASARGPHAGQARGRVRQPGVVGFGLSNDERRGTIADFAPAFRIAARAGLRSVPHGGELAGPASVRACLDELHADRIGHGVSAAADPRCCAAWPRQPGHAGGLPDLQRGARRRRHRAGRAAAAHARGRASRLRSAPTTRCCSALASRRSTSWPGRSTGSPTLNWPASPGCPCSARRPRRKSQDGCWQASTTGSPPRRA